MQRKNNNNDNIELEIRPVRPNDKGDNDVFKLDCREPDGSDPLDVHDFLKTKALDYHRGKISTVFLVKQNKRVVAFFTLSMTSLESSRFSDDVEDEDDNLEKNNLPKRYPAVLLGQMGVDKDFRKKGFGKMICKFCLGLSFVISERVACRYIVLVTNQDKANYYGTQMGVQAVPFF